MARKLYRPEAGAEEQQQQQADDVDRRAHEQRGGGLERARLKLRGRAAQ